MWVDDSKFDESKLQAFTFRVNVVWSPCVDMVFSPPILQDWERLELIELLPRTDMPIFDLLQAELSEDGRDMVSWGQECGGFSGCLTDTDMIPLQFACTCLA